METTVSNPVDTKKIAKKRKTKLKLRYFLILFGLILICCGYESIITLQSTELVEDGVGDNLKIIIYSGTALFSVFVAPGALRLFGPKKCLIFSEFGYVVFVVANVIENRPFLYIGAIAASIAESIFWICIGILFVYFAKKYRRYSERSEELCIMLFCGYLLGLYQFSTISGSININHSLFIFSLLLAPMNSDTMANMTNITNFGNAGSDSLVTMLGSMQTLSNSTVENSLIFCGTNDCQENEVKEDPILKIIPRNRTTIYIISGSCILAMLWGILIHALAIPEMPFSSFNEQSKTEEALEVAESETHSKKTTSFNPILQTSLKATKDLLLQFFQLPQLIYVTPYAMYFGIHIGFTLIEAKRAFASCVLGELQGSFALVAYGYASLLLCISIGKYLGKMGRVPLLIFGVVFDLSLFVLCLSWQPTVDKNWMVYVIFALLGISNATVQMVTATLFGSANYKTKETSFNIWRITFLIGFALQNVFSTIQCLKVKLGIMMVWVTLSSLLAVIHERKLKKIAPRNNLNMVRVVNS